MRTGLARRGIGLTLLLCAAAAGWGDEVFAPKPSSGVPILQAHYPVDGRPEADIGVLKVENVGRVSFVASRDGLRVLVRAVDRHRDALGRAESTVGIGDTPIYIKSPRGLLKIEIRWIM